MSPYLEQQILRSLAIQDDLRGQFAKAFAQPYVSPEQNIKQMVEQYEAFTRAFQGQTPVAPDQTTDKDNED